MAFFSRIKFEAAPVKGVACPNCGGVLIFERSCLTVMLACRGCGKRHDPARFAAQLGDDMDEGYATVPMDRM